MEKVILNNGVEMPMVGLGTFQISADVMTKTIATAYELGYRKFDTAWRYGNEQDIAQALKTNGINRQDVFITTKVNADALYFGGCKSGLHGLMHVRNFKSVSSVIEQSFHNLNTDYIDLFLIHWPWPIPIVQKMYKALTKYYKEGRIRAIGICSSLPPHIDAFRDVSDVCPAVNQFEISPLNTQKQLIDYCQKEHIQVEAMSTLSHFRSSETRKEITENSLVEPIAEKYNKSIPQVILRWLIQQGISIVPKSTNPGRLEENISIFDFQLTPSEMAIIDSLDKGAFLNYDPYATFHSHNISLGRVPKKYRNWEGFKNNTQNTKL